jgi:hypothetical protein
MLEKFRVVRDGNLKVLRSSSKKISGHPEVITDINTLARSNLKLKLSRHGLKVNTRDFNSCIQASFVVSIHNGSAISNVSTNRAVKCSLSSRETIVWPANWFN